MEWNAIFELIDPQLLIVVAVCWVLGLSIKQVPRVPDWSIVFILTVFAIATVIGLTGLSVQAVLQGILCAAVAVYGHQLAKQAHEGSRQR
ncbi:phage holin family protein [Paenibacillus sp. GCM10027626]|uniref:phage holin family protein n=1 Tax=Paenibacillus sp. GCM10027626 TaxID=3273411 RepID=UPI00364567EB